MSDSAVSRAEFNTLLAELEDVKRRLFEFEKQGQGTDEPSEDVALVIAAAVAAYMGKKATIRFVRRIGDPDVWRQQGRAALQASHAMPRTHAHRHEIEQERSRFRRHSGEVI